MIYLDFNQKYIFKNDRVYNMVITPNELQICNIPFNTLCEFFKDGRKSGFLIESIIANMFINLILAPSEKSIFDLVNKNTNKTYQVKTVTKYGTTSAPSKLLGAGRKYNPDLHIEYLLGLDYFIYSDIRKFPMIDLYCIPTDSKDLLEQKITCKKFNEIKKKCLSKDKFIEIIQKSYSKQAVVDLH